MSNSIEVPPACYHHAELAQLWGCTRKTVLRLIHAGELPAVQLGPKTYAIAKIDAGTFYATRKKAGLSSYGSYGRGGRPWGS